MRAQSTYKIRDFNNRFLSFVVVVVFVIAFVVAFVVVFVSLVSLLIFSIVAFFVVSLVVFFVVVSTSIFSSFLNRRMRTHPKAWEIRAKLIKYNSYLMLSMRACFWLCSCYRVSFFDRSNYQMQSMFDVQVLL